jgi:hypothetical protein
VTITRPISPCKAKCILAVYLHNGEWRADEDHWFWYSPANTLLHTRSLVVGNLGLIWDWGCKIFLLSTTKYRSGLTRIEYVSCFESSCTK